MRLSSYYYILSVGLLIAAPVFVSGQTTYYINAETGSDDQEGTRPAAAWKSLTPIGRVSFGPGDSLLFRGGQAWNGSLELRGAGAEGRPVVVGKYGPGGKPAIHGGGAQSRSTDEAEPHSSTLYLYNPDYWVISDLELTNYSAAEEGNTSLENWEAANVTEFAEKRWPEQMTEPRTRKSGILVEARNKGAVRGLHFINLEIHGVNGDMATKHNGGIFLRIAGGPDETPTYFDDLLIEGCHIHDVDRTGISNVSYYEDRSVDENDNWTPSLNFVVRNNTFERTGANALILRVAHGPLIERNLFDHCSIKGSGNAFFNFNTDSTLMQHNEARYTKYNLGDHDAGGIDSDFRTKWTILQYNYIHDNDFGPLVTGGQMRGGGFNVGTVVRYNVFENDGILRDTSEGKYNWVFKVSGNATNTVVHDNIFLVGSDKQDRALIYHKDWGGGIPRNTAYLRNVFYNRGMDTFYQLDESEQTDYHSNKVYGFEVARQPDNPDGSNISIRPVGEE